VLKDVIEKLLAGQHLTKEESSLAITEVLSGANPSRIAAFLVLMRAKKETVDELHGIIDVMRAKMQRVSISLPVLDIVGTGGDGAHTLNISTASALLAAACGVKVAKHGNRSVSSLSGSADVLEALGIAIHSPASSIVRSIEEIGIGFMFAPDFHPFLQQVKEVRKALGLRTLFNLIGPLLNPAGPHHLMLGVSQEDLLETVAALMMRLGEGKSMVFHGCGLDELSTMGPAKVIEVSGGGMRSFQLDPLDYGLKRCALEDLKGKEAAYNAAKIVEALDGRESPFADTIALNAGVAVYLYGIAETVQEGILLAQSQLKNKSALNLLNKWKAHV
jgi:anthranilate phosphoribosyltransferase